MGRDRSRSKRGGRGGGRRQYVYSEEDLERRNALEQQARKKRSDDDEEEEAGSGEEEAESDEELPPIVERKRLSELEPEEDEEEEKGEEAKRSGPAAVIKTANPNRDRKQGKMMKMKDIGKLADDPDAGPRLTRREREELEAQRRKEEERQKYLAGETEQARRDLERLAMVRKRREEAQKKREEEAAREAKAREEALAKTGVGEESDEESDKPLDSREIKGMNPTQLKAHLKARNLSIQGSKKELMTRLLEYEANRNKT